MAGIYIHIPFCRQKCHYCDFYSKPLSDYQDEMIACIIEEFELRSEYLAGEVIQSIYFGGGTPSILQPENIYKILEKINTVFSLANDIEITAEINPDDIFSFDLPKLKKSGVNRISAGIQSFSDIDLRLMNRRHTAIQSKDCIKILQDTGFSNISIDLIYGLPAQTSGITNSTWESSFEQWQKNLQITFLLDISHISAYHLSFEPGTAFYIMKNRGKLTEASEDHSYNQFILLINEAEKHGFVQYEISNFAKPGYISRHNSNYWSGKKYLGAGPSAHSFNTNSRQWNVADNLKYIQSVRAGNVLCESETLDDKAKYNEYIMTSLRTLHGICFSKIEEEFGRAYMDYCNNSMTKYLSSGHVIKTNKNLILTNPGKFISDQIISDLFIL